MQETEQTYLFDAFISYSRKDGKFAKKLEAKLERYRLPKGVLSPRRKLSIFRDVQDLVGNELSESIKDALIKSEHLIVLCSPNSRKSKWVETEIEEFTTFHSKDKIIPVLISGRPNSEVTPEDALQDQSFPHVLYRYFDEPLAADYRFFQEDTYQQRRIRYREAKFQILAFLFAKEKEELLNRQRNRAIKLLSLVVVGLLFLLVAFAWISYKAVQARNEAEWRANIAESRALAIEAVMSLEDDPLRTLILAIEANRREKTYEAQGALRKALQVQQPYAVFRHAGVVSHATFSPDSKLLVTTSEDKTARIWNVKTGHELHILHHSKGVNDAAFSPDGKWVVTGDDNGISHIWSTETGLEKSTLAGDEYIAHSVGFSSDGQYVVSAGIADVKIWEWETANLVHTLRHRANNVSFSPDDKRVLTTGGKITRIWDAETGIELHVLHSLRGGINYATFSPDGHRVATVSDEGSVQIWDSNTGSLLLDLQGHREMLLHAAFSRNGNLLVTTSGDGTARTWNLADGTELALLLGHNSWVEQGVFSPDGERVVTGGCEWTARIWAARTGLMLAMLRGHTGEIEHIAFSPDGNWLITASDDGTARLWQQKLGGEIAVLVGHENRVVEGEFSPDGSRVVTRDYITGRTSRLWDAKTGEQIAVFEGFWPLPVFNLDGTSVLSANGDGTVRLWNTNNGHELTVLTGHQGRLEDMAFSKDDRLIVTASEDGTARLWDAKTGQEMRVFQGHKGDVRLVVLDPSNRRIVTVGENGTARLWDVKTGRQIAFLNDREGKTLFAKFSPNGKVAMSVNENLTIRLWEAETGREIKDIGKGLNGSLKWLSQDGTRALIVGTDSVARIINPYNGEELAVLSRLEISFDHAVFSQDGKLALTIGSKDLTPRLWETETGREVAAIRSHGGGIQFAIFSPNGKHLVTVGEAGDARLWETGKGQELATLPGHVDKINHVAFSPDGRRVLTSSDDNTARIYTVDLDELESLAKSRLPVNMSEEDHKRMLQ